MLQQILWGKKNRWQIFGAAFGAFVGLLLVLIALQFYADVQTVVKESDGMGEDWVMINKQVSILNTIGLGNAFSEKDIQEIKNQSFIEDVGSFTSNRFRLLASSATLGFQTELFFEALPDEYVDVKSSRFRWKEGDQEVPMILSKDYLALYNFGFAPSQGLPQFTQSTISKVSFTLIIVGKSGQTRMKGRIIGFSDRINSVLVPQNYLDWANKRFGDSEAEPPSRLLLKTNNPDSKELKEFLKENAYEVSAGKLIGDEARTLLNVVISAIAGIGVLLVLLSLLVFILNFQLIISKSSDNITKLLELGYKHQTISKILSRQLFLVFGGVILSTIVVMIALRYPLISWFEGQGFEIDFSFSPLIYLTLIGFSIVFLGVNLWNIRTNVLKLAS